MSEYQRLYEHAATDGDGDDDNNATTRTKQREASNNAAAAAATTTNTTKTRLRVANENRQKMVLFNDSNSSDSSIDLSGRAAHDNRNNKNKSTHTKNSNNNNTNSNSSDNSSNSLNSRSSATSSWEYSPFDNDNAGNANINEINRLSGTVEMTKTTTTAAMLTPTTTIANNLLLTTPSKTSSTSLLLDAYDADDTTMEVPLLAGGNNNIDYHDHNNRQLSFDAAAAAAYANSNAVAATCHCQLPGFSANLRTKSTQDAKIKILLAITLCCIFMIVEFLGGYMAGSLAIMTDAAHLASDCISFVIGLVAIWLGGRPPDDRMSFGYKRMEVMGAIISILGIWILTATLIMMAIERLYSNDFDLNVNTMMVISGIGILINIVMVFILHGSSLGIGAAHGHSHSHSHNHSHAHSHSHSHGMAATETTNDNALLQMNGSNVSDNELKHANKCDTDENLNLRAAMIHVIGDLVQSIGVFLASILIQIYPSAKFADPLCTVLFSIIVFMTTIRLFRESVGILLDAVPPRLSLDMLAMDLINIDGVKSVHHLNVWSHTNNYNVMMVHLDVDFLADSNTVLQRATQVACGNKYNIKHCTIQMERLTS